MKRKCLASFKCVAYKSKIISDSLSVQVGRKEAQDLIYQQ